MHHLSRRSLLQTVTLGAGAPLLAPILSRLEAAQSGKRPARFVFLVEGNGLWPKHVQPEGIERKIQRNVKNHNAKQNAAEKLVDLKLSAPGHKLPPALAPLAPFQDRLTVVQGLSGRVCGGGHSNDFGGLGAYSGRAGAKNITIDAALARRNPAIFQHVAMGISTNQNANVIYGCSASGPNQKVPTYTNPALAYEMLYGKILKGNPKDAVGAQRMLLDHIAQDIKRVEGQLPAEERRKLNQYRDAYASIGARQARLGEIDASKIHPRTKKYDSAVETDRLDCQFEIAATALITGMTNVVTLASGAGGRHFEITFSGLGITANKHAIGHGQVDGSNEMAIKIRAFHTGLIARLMEQLRSIPEGDGTMLDNTLIVYLSENAEAHHSLCYEWPVVMLGNLGGRLKAGDRFLNYPKYGLGGHRTMANLYTTFLHACGDTREHFGEKDAELEGAIDQDGPLSELLA